MLTFFRRIRKGLLDMGKVRKYLLYAMGEVLLVMVGILLALQINNWNEARKDRIEEIKIYRELINDLDECIREVENDIERDKEDFISIGIVINHIIHRYSFHDSLIRHLNNLAWDQQFYPKSSGFESLKSTGLSIISNDSIRLALTDLYQLTFERLIDKGREETHTFGIMTEVIPFLNKHLRLDNNVDLKAMEDLTAYWVDMVYEGIAFYKIKIADYHAFINDAQFAMVLQRFLNDRLIRFGWSYKALEEAKKVKIMIDDELNKSP